MSDTLKTFILSDEKISMRPLRENALKGPYRYQAAELSLESKKPVFRLPQEEASGLKNALSKTPLKPECNDFLTENACPESAEMMRRESYLKSESIMSSNCIHRVPETEALMECGLEKGEGEVVLEEFAEDIISNHFNINMKSNSIDCEEHRLADRDDASFYPWSNPIKRSLTSSMAKKMQNNENFEEKYKADEVSERDLISNENRFTSSHTKKVLPDLIISQKHDKASESQDISINQEKQPIQEKQVIQGIKPDVERLNHFNPQNNINSEDKSIKDEHDILIERGTEHRHEGLKAKDKLGKSLWRSENKQDVYNADQAEKPTSDSKGVTSSWSKTAYSWNRISAGQAQSPIDPVEIPTNAIQEKVSQKSLPGKNESANRAEMTEIHLQARVETASLKEVKEGMVREAIHGNNLNRVRGKNGRFNGINYEKLDVGIKNAQNNSRMPGIHLDHDDMKLHVKNSEESLLSMQNNVDAIEVKTQENLSAQIKKDKISFLTDKAISKIARNDKRIDSRSHKSEDSENTLHTHPIVNPEGSTKSIGSLFTQRITEMSMAGHQISVVHRIQDQMRKMRETKNSPIRMTWDMGEKNVMTVALHLVGNKALQVRIDAKSTEIETDLKRGWSDLKRFAAQNDFELREPYFINGNECYR